MRNATHFVGFKPGDGRFCNATKAFGAPDFVHRYLDVRAIAEFMPGDRVIFANGDADNQAVNPYTYDDSANK